MRKIYPAAKLVVVDLGDEFDAFKAATILLKRFSRISHHNWQALVQRRINADNYKIRGFLDRIWDSLISFYDRAWFQRTWVVQEYALAKKLQILVGDRHLSGEVLSKGISRAIDFLFFSRLEMLLEYYRGVGEVKT